MARTSPSIRQVAERAGVSVGTVSNVLNRPNRVSDQTRRRVERVIEELQFIRNDSARHLREGSSRTIGLVVLDITNPFFTDVARGVEQRANGSGLAVFVCNSDANDDKEHAHLRLLAEMRVKGVLINPVTESETQICMLRDRGIPVVLFDRQAATQDECSVAVDDVAGGQQAIQHLITQGHRDIAFVSGPLSIRQISDRFHGASLAADAADHAVRIRAFPQDTLNVEAGRTAGREIAALPDAERPSAAFCTNDLIALGVLQSLTAAGLRVPEDVAIVGYDDIEFAAAAAVPLSSVEQPRQKMGATGVDLLLEETEGAHRHRQVVYQPKLIVRESSSYRVERGGTAASSA